MLGLRHGTRWSHSRLVGHEIYLLRSKTRRFIKSWWDSRWIRKEEWTRFKWIPEMRENQPPVIDAQMVKANSSCRIAYFQNGLQLNWIGFAFSEIRKSWQREINDLMVISDGGILSKPLTDRTRQSNSLQLSTTKSTWNARKPSKTNRNQLNTARHSFL